MDKNNSSYQKPAELEHKEFFNYDEIDYYVIDYDKEKLGDLYDNQSKSIIDSLKMKNHFG